MPLGADYYLSLANSYRRQKESLSLGRDEVREKAADLHARWYEGQEPSEDDDIPTVEQLESALWEWVNRAVSALIEDAAYWTGQESSHGIATHQFDQALNRALVGKPSHLDAFLDERIAEALDNAKQAREGAR